MGFLPTWLNPFDVLIVLGLLGGAALGFIRGLVRMALSLLVLYLATVLAMTLYVIVGRWISYMSGLSVQVSQGVGFMLVLILTAILLNFILHRAYRDTELPGLRQIDQLGGMVIGFLVASIWIGLVIVALAFVLGVQTTAEDSIRPIVVARFQGSNLIPIFYDFLPIAMATLRPWMPKGLPPDIFTFRL